MVDLPGMKPHCWSDIDSIDRSLLALPKRYATQGEYECHTCTEFYSRCIFRSELINGVEDVGNCIIVITNSVRAGLQASAQSAYFGLGTFGRALSIGSLAFAILFLPPSI